MGFLLKAREKVKGREKKASNRKYSKKLEKYIFRILREQEREQFNRPNYNHSIIQNILSQSFHQRIKNLKKLVNFPFDKILSLLLVNVFFLI